MLTENQIMQSKRVAKKMDFATAMELYPHRYTMQHIPNWAMKQAPNGKYYAPQYKSDREWYDNTLFPPHHPLGKRCQDCYTSGATWPLGMWLDEPYKYQR